MTKPNVVDLDESASTVEEVTDKILELVTPNIRRLLVQALANADLEFSFDGIQIVIDLDTHEPSYIRWSLAELFEELFREMDDHQPHEEDYGDLLLVLKNGVSGIEKRLVVKQK